MLQVALVDAWGNRLRLAADDIQWTWPRGFDTTPYGSFGCIQDYTCQKPER